MSRIGKAPITIPAGVTVSITHGGDYAHQLVTVTGPKGTLSESIRKGVNVTADGANIILTRDDEQKQTKSNHGLYRSLVANLVKGVTEGFSKELQIIGIGYRAELQGNKLVMSLGFAHKVEFMIPEGIVIEVKDQTEMKVSGINKQQVGEIAAKLRAYRAPEPYKGKGIRYKDEKVRRKSVKQA
jgi:large subunit ribosomal protein L6